MSYLFRRKSRVRNKIRNKGPVEYLVTGEAGSLPDRTSTQRYFSQYGHVDHVKETDEGLLVMFNDAPSRTVCSSSPALHGTHHRVDGHRVTFHLLRPDVYGCDVTVTRHRVSVTVGDEVIRRMKQDKTYKQFIQALLNRQVTIGQVMVSFLPNQIEVQPLDSPDELRVSGCEWELRVLQQITAFLKPFQDLLPQTPKNTSCRERCIHQECRKETSQSKDLDTNDGEAIAVFMFRHEGKLQVAAGEDTLKQLRQSYPTIDISCDTGMKTLTLRGPARAMYEAREDMFSRLKNLTTQIIKLEPWKVQVLNNPDARKRIQRTLVKNNILCFWEMYEFLSGVMIEVTALRKDQRCVKQVFELSFQTINILFDENQQSSLQSDAWKLCLEGLQTSKEGEPAPVVDVRVNAVVIRGLTVSLESARRAVLDFFHRNVVQAYPQLYGQEVEEVITGLKPWQIKFLMNINLKERIVAELPDLALLDVQSDSFVIRAPLHVLTESVSQFWRFIASLSHREIHLTTALAEMYKQPAARSKVQTLLKAAGLSCQWEVEDDHITVSAEDADQEPLKQIFTSAFSEASVHVAPEKSHLLRSEDFQALVTELEERKRGSPAPLIQTSPSDNCVIIVDDSKSCATVQRATKTLIENHDVLTSASQETQTQSPQHENIGAQTEVEEIQTEERHKQTDGKNFRSTEQQTDNRQLENKEQQTQDSSEQEQRTERPMLTENGFQTDKITTKEQQLQTDQSQLESTGQQTEDNENDKRLQTETRQTQSNESQLRKENTNSETHRTQTEKQQPENQPMQTQREHRQTQTDESENKTHEQSLHERMETQGTQTTSPDFKNKKQASPQTERTPADEEVAPSEQGQRRMQRSDVQFDSRDCPADHQHHYPRHDNVGTAQYTCQEDIKTGDSTQEDEAQTFPKYICEPQQEQRTPPQDHATPSGDIVQQRLLCLTVEQLLKVATHLGIGQQTLDQLQFRCPAPDDLKRHLTEACRAASDTETLFMAVLRVFARPAVTGSSENSSSHHRNSQTLPMSTADSEYLSGTISVEHNVELSVHGQFNQLATGAQLTSSFSPETQGTALESFVQSDTETCCLILPPLCNPQPLNSVDPVALLHFTQADPCLFSGMSTAADLQGSGSSTTSGQYTPVLASMLLSSAASSGPLSPRTSQQQVTQPAHAARNAQCRSLVDYPQTHDRDNTVASDWHSRVRVDLTDRAGNEARLHPAQPPVIDVESLVQINQRLRQLEALVMQRDQGPQPPTLSAECHARLEAQITQRFHQVELQMLDRLDALVQLRLQSASVADSRVYLSQMRAMEIEMQARMESQFSHLRAQTMIDVRREIDVDIRGVIAVDNASSSSSHSAPPSEISD